MRTYICEDVEKYKSFLESHSACNFAQSTEWAKVKSAWTSRVIVAEDKNGNIKGSLNILIRKLPILNYSVMMSSRGPVCDSHDEETITALLNEAKKLAKQYKAYVLRLEPDVPVHDKKFEEIVRRLGFKICKRSKNFEGINPRFVYRKKIGGMSEEELIQSFHSKWRYNVRLAKRKGVEIKIGDKSDLEQFYKIMQITGQRDNFTPRSLEYFENMFDCMTDKHLRLFLAYYQGKLLAGIICIMYGKKCWYLYGASSNEYRNVMPSHLLQWEAMKWALKEGCELYDFRGVSGDMNENNPLYGIYRFKKGFNGELVELIGEIDYIFNPFIFYLEKLCFKLIKRLRKIKVKLKKLGGKNETTGNRKGKA